MADRLITDCNANGALDLIADKWTLYVFKALYKGHNRFGQLLRTIPQITRKMLTQTLRKMQRDGLIRRIDYQKMPLHVEYILTPLGERLLANLHPLFEFAETFFPDVEAARQQFDAKADKHL
jgi:DNA-binding HxlR family transcriptional regulator